VCRGGDWITHNILHITNGLEGVPQVSRHLPFNGIYDISLGDLGDGGGGGGGDGWGGGRKW